MAHLCRYVFATLVSLVLISPTPSLRANDEAARLVGGIRTSDQLIADLEYMVVKLAGRDQAWVNSILPNIEIFLIGVATDQPLRFDFVLDAEHGRRVQGIIPIDRLNDFLQDNLDPIGIEPVRVRGDSTLHELKGKVYEGWLRYLEKPTPYAVFFPKEQFPTAQSIPKEFPNLLKQHERVIQDGFGSFVHLINGAQGAAARRSAAQKLRAEALEKLQKTPEESRNAFELRKAIVEQRMNVVEQWLVEAAEVKGGLAIDQQKGNGTSLLHIAALPDTQLHRNIERVGQEASHFQAVASPDNSVLRLRVNFPIDPGRVETYQNIYELARPTWTEEIQQDATLTDAEKQARVEMLGLMLDVFSASAALPSIDLFLDIFPGQQSNAVVFGVRATGREKIEQIIEKLPVGVSRWSVDRNVDEVGGVSIHKVSMGQKVPKSIANFYGTSGDTFVAVSEHAVWLSGGENGLEHLKSRLQTVQQNGNAAADDKLLTWNMQVRPMLQFLYEFMNDDELQLTKRLRGDGGVLARVRQRNQEAPERDEDVPGSRARSALQNFQWEATAIEALAGQPDTLDVVVRRSGAGTVTAPGLVEQGVLRALGAVIAKFAEENLE